MRLTEWCGTRASRNTASPNQWRGVDPNRDRQTGLVDPKHRERAGIIDVSEGLTDGHLLDTSDGHDLSRPSLRDFHPVERLSSEELGDARPVCRPVLPTPRHDLAPAELPLDDAADGEATEIRRGVQVGDQGL